MTLYKYISSAVALKVLQERLLRFSQCPVLNDPFDSVPIVTEFPSTEQLRPFVEAVCSNPPLLEELFQKVLLEGYQKLPPPIQARVSLAQWLEYSRPLLAEKLQQIIANSGVSLSTLVAKVMSDDKESHRHDAERMLRDAITNNLGILCLSATCVHPLLWAHYADSHRGVAIGFDQNHPYFADARAVRYVSTRASVSFQDIFDDTDLAKSAAMSIVFTKHTDWAYENEYRMIRPLAAAQKADQLDFNGFPICLFNFPESCMAEVIFGARISPENMASIKSLLNHERYQHVQLNYAHCNPRDFSIDISPEAA